MTTKAQFDKCVRGVMGSEAWTANGPKNLLQ